MRIAVWTGAYQYWQSVHPENLLKANAPQMGGSEAAALSIAQTLAAQGHQVLFGSKVDFPESFGNLRTCPLDLFPTALFVEQFDALVTWDATPILRMALPHIPVKVVCFQLNDAQLGVYQHTIDLYFHPSRWHAQRFGELYDIPEDKQRIGLTNGIDPRMFMGMPARQPYVVWASSPDRGLHHLLGIWPQILEQVPEAELHIYYDMDRWLQRISEGLAQGVERITTREAQLVQQRLAGLENMTYHGGVSKIEVAAALLGAKVLAYPCDPVAPTEGFSMTTLEAWIAGCDVVISDADALQELWGGLDGVTCLPLPFQEDVWIDAVVKGLQKEIVTGPRLVPEPLTWDYIAREWVKEIENARP